MQGQGGEKQRNQRTFWLDDDVSTWLSHLVINRKTDRSKFVNALLRLMKDGIINIPSQQEMNELLARSLVEPLEEQQLEE